MKPRYLNGDKASTVFAQMMRRALPGNGSKFANTEPSPVSTSLAVAKQGEASEGPERDGNKPLMRNRAAHEPSPTGSTASDTFQHITEAEIAAKVQNTVGTGPDFDTLLTDPEYDRRATAIPAAREEQE